MTGNPQAIAVVGLGAMGLPVSRRLLAAGFEVRGFDRSDGAMALFGRAGGIVSPSAASAAQGAAALLLLVVNDVQAEDVLFGAAGAACGLPPGAVVILSLTTAPRNAAEIGARLEGTGLRMVDCPVSGGVKRAETGALSLIASGPPQSIDAARPYLAPLGSVRVVGDRHGQASSVKLINQLLCGIHIAAAAEAVALAEKASIDLPLLYDVINASSGASAMFADRVPMMQGGSERTTAAIDILVKDLGLVVDLGDQLHARLPLTQRALGLFCEASADGLGACNDSEVIRLLRAAREE
jgi:3-hydroxyisobutyrate dehydrogenase